MRDFFKSGRFRLLCGLLALVLVGMFLAAAMAGKQSPQSTVMGTIFSPLQSVSSKLANSLSNIWSNAAGVTPYQEQIDALKKQVADLQGQLVDYQALQKQNALYETILELKKEHEDFKFASAEVLGRDSADAYYSFTINKGSNDGIAVNDPVIYDKYLVGVVTKVTPTTAAVRSILDSKQNVSVYESRTREAGIVTGDSGLAKDGLCRMTNLPQNTAVTQGGIICTSGVGGVFPRDLQIGTVKSVQNETVDISAYAVIEPGVDIRELRDVFVITQFDGQGENAS